MTSRVSHIAKYPYDKKTGKIELPAELEEEIKRLAERGDMVNAMKRVMDLTGAGLRYSKDYIDQFRHYPTKSNLI